MILYNNVFSGGKTKDNIVKVTYAELTALGAAKNFDTSVVYQLTDYEAIDGWTEGLTQKFSNNGKRFDILLTATSNEFLSCSAGATKHDGNNSFSEINLSKWRLTYASENLPIQDFAYLNLLSQPINMSNSKGCIIMLIDQNNNTVNFDFKTILINGNPIFGYDGIEISELDNLTHDNTYIIDFTSIDDPDGTLNYQISQAQNNTIIASCVVYNGGSQLKGSYLICNKIIGSSVKIYNAGAMLQNAKILNSRNISISHNGQQDTTDLKVINCNNLTIKQAVAYTTFKHLSDKDITVESHPNKSVIYQSAEDTVITL